MLGAPSLMLDTNVIGELAKGDEDNPLVKKLQKSSPAQVFVSSITEAELQYGLAKKPGATRLGVLMRTFLSTVQIVAFDSEAARLYGRLRSQYEQDGLSVGAIDGLIAAHALTTDSTLVTRDRALLRLNRWVSVELW